MSGFRVASEEEVAALCRARRSARSSATCEVPLNCHDGKPHAGRTRGGYWKFWERESDASR